MLDALVGYIAYWAVGFGVANGNEGGNAFMGLQALFSFDVKTVSHVTNWFLQLVFAANAATIVSGSIAERCHFSAYLAYSFIITGNLIFLDAHIFKV